MATAVLDRLEISLPRRQTTVRCTYAFHAREIRFEIDSGEGFSNIFPETFSFHPEQHDPAELMLQLDDLWSNPQRFGSNATKRDAEEFVVRLLACLPDYLDKLVHRLEVKKDFSPETMGQVYEDVAIFVWFLQRLIHENHLGEKRPIKLPALHLRKLLWRTLDGVVVARVPRDVIRNYRLGKIAPVDPLKQPSEVSHLFTMLEEDLDGLYQALLNMAERAFYAWFEDVCLDETNGAFETEDSPFESREAEILKATTRDMRGNLERAHDFSSFLRRTRNKDCIRILEKLEGWFLRQYDVGHAASVIHHRSHMTRGKYNSHRILSWHSTRNYVFGLIAMAMPFYLATFFYEKAPPIFDLMGSLEVLVADGVVLWFLLDRFAWKKDLTFFYASVPRITAGIVVGYLPVFLIDEVWDLARQSWLLLGTVSVLLGSMTLLYIYVEVQRRLDDPQEAFARARSIFLLGILQALGIGIVITSVLGPFMVGRNWTADFGTVATLDQVRATTEPFVGQLPRIIGIEPFVSFPTAVFLMTFLSFFIGTFLQLLWEDFPITEPL